MSESVLIVHNSLLQTIIRESSGCLITREKGHIFDNILNNQIFMPRNEAEYNFEYKQIIPYVVIRNKKDYFLLKRLNRQTEKRLHNKYSLGIGGHINPESGADHSNIIVNGLFRELNEEVSTGDIEALNFIGIINDESNSVSRVHLGLLYILELSAPDCRVLETDKMTAEWVPQSELISYYSVMETWSQIVTDQYINKNKGVRGSRVQGVK